MKKIWAGPGVLHMRIKDTVTIIGPGDELTAPMLSELGPLRVKELEDAGRVESVPLIDGLLRPRQYDNPLTAEEKEEAQRIAGGTMEFYAGAVKGVVDHARLHPEKGGFHEERSALSLGGARSKE